MITVAEYPFEGYALMLKKDTAKRCCPSCIKSFLKGKPFQVKENEGFLTVYSLEGQGVLGL
jgi:hypothetical protein